MTRDLKALMDRATDRSDMFTPDPAVLVTAGRRRVRHRRVATSLTALAAVVILAASGLVAGKLHDPRAAAPASHTTSRPQDARKLCTTSNGTVLRADAWGWAEVLALSDRYGSASIRKAPTTRRGYVTTYAFCVTQPAGGINVPLGNRGGVLVRRSVIDRRSSVTTVFGRAYGAGRKVVVLTADGKSGEALVRSEFYVYRHVETAAWQEASPSVITRTFDAHGNLETVGQW